MSYIDGFVLAVPTANTQKFIDHSKKFESLFLEHGATRVLESNPMSFDGMRMIYGVFTPVVEFGQKP